ncbi:MAG: hypothetical protein RSB86_19050 [Comamonas sp.]|uniref:hypothetical protein n=1 Tax=Comamonas sp. TaxID=34028 RepID=UPI002FC73ED5
MDIRDFLSRLRVDSGPNAKGEYMCNCPAHDDKNASLSVSDGEKGIVLYCHTKRCSSDAIVKAMGLCMRDLFHEQLDSSSVPGKVVHTGNTAAPAPAKRSGGKKPRGKFVCAYAYTDETGKTLFEACRYQREDGSKTFSLRQPDPDKPGEYKYTKEGARLVLYRLPEVRAAIKAGKPVFVVEGEKDCDNMAALGYTATTNPMGAGKWHAGEYTPSLKDADVYIIPDNDVVGREHALSVAQAVLKVAKAVHILDLVKALQELPAKGDISDFFKLTGKKKGNELLAKLMQEAEAVSPSATEQRDATAEYYGKIFGYCVDGGRICQETQDGPKPLANFVALPVGVVARDDGVTIVKEMVIDGWSANGQILPRVHIKSNQFSGMNWVAECWDFAASIMPGNATKDKLRYAISEVGRVTAKRLTEYTHTGWRQIGGKWAYLYQGGAIGAEGVTVDLGSGLSMYRLDGNGLDGFAEISYRDGALMTLATRKLMAEHVATPLLGTIFLAPLREFLMASGVPPAYVLFLLGSSGTHKSTAIALELSHFGYFTAKSLPASFNDTANFIRKKAFLLKDAPIVVDDYHPVTNLQERKKMEATAQSLARAFGDGAERGRMKSDLTLQESMPPRGVAIIDGEDIPSVGESGMARFYICNVGENDIPVGDELTDMQEIARQGYLQKSMCGYIKWLIAQADDLPKLLHEEFIQNRAVALKKTKGQHGRTAEAIAHMMLGYHCMLRYMRDIQAITTEEAVQMEEEAWTVITQTSQRQAEEMKDERPSKLFLACISELLTSKSAGVRDLSAGDGAGTGAREMIGYMDASFYYLLPNTAYGAVAKMCNEQGQAFPLTSKMLYKQMREDGVLTSETTTSTSATRPKWIDGKSQRVLYVPRKYIDGPRVMQEQQQMPLDGCTQVDGGEMPF